MGRVTPTVGETGGVMDDSTQPFLVSGSHSVEVGLRSPFPDPEEPGVKWAHVLLPQLP